MTNKPKVAESTPTALAKVLIADLGNGGTTCGGDRYSRYFVAARGIGQYENAKVCVSLIEEKPGENPDDWGYALHIINDVDDMDCELQHTDSLDEQELVSLLEEVLSDIGCEGKRGEESMSYTLTSICEKVQKELEAAQEAFSDDVLEALNVSDFTIDFDIPSDNSNILRVNCFWKRLSRKFSKEFEVKSGDTQENLVDKVKSYLFDVLITIINLR